MVLVVKKRALSCLAPGFFFNCWYHIPIVSTVSEDPIIMLLYYYYHYYATVLLLYYATVLLLSRREVLDTKTQ